MNNLTIIIAPDQRLLKVSKPVKDINREVKLLLEDMLDTMYKSNGIGLAAPQVGILKRLIVMDCSNKNDKNKPIKFINPEILEEARKDPLNPLQFITDPDEYVDNVVDTVATNIVDAYDVRVKLSPEDREQMMVEVRTGVRASMEKQLRSHFTLKR